MESVFTVTEVARVLRAVEGRFGLTPRGIRYHARTGMIVPTGRMRASSRAPATRLYTAVDVGVLRLACRLRRLRVHERAVWGLLVYRGEEVRRRLADGSGQILLADAALAVACEDSASPKSIRIDVASLMGGLIDRLEVFRQRRPNLWTGRAWVPAHEVAEHGRG